MDEDEDEEVYDSHDEDDEDLDEESRQMKRHRDVTKRRHGSVRLQSWTRCTLAKKLLVTKAKGVFEKVWDPKTARYYYLNTETQQPSFWKPKALRNDDALDDLDHKALEIQKKKLTGNAKMQEEYLIHRTRMGRENQIKEREVKETRQRIALGGDTKQTSPYQPQFCAAVPGDGCASVWWSQSADNGYKLTAYVIQHWRFDAKVWKLKGEEKVTDLDEFDRVVTEYTVPNLANGKKYKFCVKAIGEKGKSPVSTFSNPVHSVLSG